MRPPAGDHVAEGLEKRLGHGRDDQQDEQGADRQQQPLLDPDPPLVLADRRQQELHRRPRHLPELPAVEQVDHDRDRRGGQPGQQRGIGELEGPESEALTQKNSMEDRLSWSMQRHDDAGRPRRQIARKRDPPGSDRCAGERSRCRPSGSPSSARRESAPARPGTHASARAAR